MLMEKTHPGNCSRVHFKKICKEVADFTLCRSGTRESPTIYTDLSKRDFTINAIAKDVDGKYIDPHNSVQDIQARLLRCVGNTKDRLSEDPLRSLRAMRFMIT